MNGFSLVALFMFPPGVFLSTSLVGRSLLLSISAAALLLAGGGSARAQAIATAEVPELGGISAAATTNDSGPAGIIPAVRGFNASLGTSSQHDSSNGWSSVLTPNVAYRFNRYFSADAGVPMYMYINIDANVGTKAKPVYAYSPKKGVFGDTNLSFHADTNVHTIDYNATVAMGLPSGNTDYGLGAGQVTYNINNHFERGLGKFTPDIEMGFGDTSSLVDQRVLKSYVAVGPMAHFQAGTSLDLPWNMNFEVEAYEELPLAKNLVYSTTGKGKKKVTTSTNQDPAEDNGFNTSLDIPLSRHVTLSGFYSRSLRNHDDVGGFSFTFLLKGPPKPLEETH
jgi:hypothetical protein